MMAHFGEHIKRSFYPSSRKSKPSYSIRQAVAPIVGRADLLCGFIAVIALSLTVGGGKTGRRREKLIQPCSGALISGEEMYDRRSHKGRDRHGNKTSPNHEVKLQNQSIRPERVSASTTKGASKPGRRASTAEDDVPAPISGADTAAAVGDNIGYKANRNWKAGASKGRKSGPASRANRAKTGHKLSIPPTGASGNAGSTIPGAEQRQKSAKDGDSGPRASHFIAALVLATAATLCKEIGVTVFGLIVGGDVVRFLEETGWSWLMPLPASTRSQAGALGELKLLGMRGVREGRVGRARILSLSLGKSMRQRDF